MSTEKILKLFEKISDDKKKVHRAAIAYCNDKCELVNSSYNLICVKNGVKKTFDELDEFKPLLEKIKKIEASECIIDEMFRIDEDIKKLKSYIDAGYLVSPHKIVENRETVITEAKALCDNSRNYFLIDGREMDMFDKNFSICKLRTFIDKSEKGKELTKGEIESIKSEMEKIRLLTEEGRTISLLQVDKDIEGAKGIRELLEKLDPDYYDPSMLVKNRLGGIYRIFDLKGEYDKKTILFYKFICEMIPRLIENVRKNCSKVNTDYKSRYDEELLKLNEAERYEIESVERMYSSNKATLLGNIFGKTGNKMSKGEKNNQLEEIRQRYNTTRERLERNVRDVVDMEKRKISENLDIVYKIDTILKDNTVGYKFKVI